LKFILDLNSVFPFWKLLVSEFLLRFPEAVLCSVSALLIKIVLLDTRRPLMLFEGRLMCLEPKLFLLILTIKILSVHNMSILPPVGVTYKTGFGLDDCIYCIFTFTQLGTTGNHSAIAILHTFQFTVIHALGLSIFTCRILATDLSQSHCHFK
jgi:uncharacterized membrane protein YqaE (UPF0057 family)